ncbi:acyl-CoA N-acyltransferase [Gigaspora margarita]|uniref:Acyl-CoA N-acyltransferase n=1 Tax=Gigaspora margarita TaxID=4874 RepID=A0A8H3XL13_GIGMA|nr:acyl-CoA N-acyltransferase [Gigaspora margarita]
MSIVYESSTVVDPLKSILPLRRTLKTNNPILITFVTKTSSPSLLNHLHKIFNEIIEEGTTYPQEFFLDYDGFINLFLTHNTFIVLNDNYNENNNENWDDKVMGMYYIKPNYPGRCSHICNAGFVVPLKFRNLGIGKIMAESFLLFAPLLGYKSCVFNLVFENNIASIKLWKSLGFKEIGKIPKAGRLKDSDKLIDALMFYYDFDEKN